MIARDIIVLERLSNAVLVVVVAMPAMTVESMNSIKEIIGVQVVSVFITIMTMIIMAVLIAMSMPSIVITMFVIAMVTVIAMVAVIAVVAVIAMSMIAVPSIVAIMPDTLVFFNGFVDALVLSASKRVLKNVLRQDLVMDWVMVLACSVPIETVFVSHIIRNGSVMPDVDRVYSGFMDEMVAMMIVETVHTAVALGHTDQC